jgi:DNA-binding transcriptional regulator GbsR (MarR family)
MTSDDSSSCAKFVIADRFSTERDYIQKTEDLFKVYFDIESRDEITLNVKHACKIERKKRCEQMKKRLESKQCVNKRVVEICEAALEQINAKEDETDSTKYIVYVLRQKSSL